MNAKDYLRQAIKTMGADVIAGAADVSRATVFRAANGGNVGIDPYCRIMTAIGYTVSILPSSEPQQRASGE